MSTRETNGMFRLSEEAGVKTNWRTIVLVIFATFVVGGLVTRWELKLQSLDALSSAHTIQLDSMQGKIGEIQLTQHDQNRLLNYIARGRKGEPPVTAAEPPASP